MIFAVFRFVVIHIALTHCYKLESFFTLIHYKLKSSQASKSRLQSSKHTGANRI